MKIIADAHIPYIEAYFKHCAELSLIPGRDITAVDVQDVDCLIVRSVTDVNETLLKNSRVQFVGSVTAGADHIDTAWLNHAGIAWRTAAGFNAPPVADYVLSIVAALQRKHLLGKKIKAAVIGVGHVGRIVAERFRLLDFDVVLCDPLRAQSESDFISQPLDELSNLDLICLHVPLTKEGAYSTYHFIDQAFLTRQKPGCVLLNASRGAVIDTNALLEYGKHLYWCLDVFENEPHINLEVLQRAMIATPHIAGYSLQSKLRGVHMIAQFAYDNFKLGELPHLPQEVDQQILEFAGYNHHWQDIVLGIFNPIILTAMMRQKILIQHDEEHAFDAMRREFNYRYEFSATTIQDVSLSEDDTRVLLSLGVTIK